jgi:5-(carboxyamino)imidazole ribonucleotide mutase
MKGAAEDERMRKGGTGKRPEAKAKRPGGKSDDPTGLSPSAPPLVAVVMGQHVRLGDDAHASEVLERFGVPHECRVVSAHRTPALMSEFAVGAEARGLEVVIAGAGARRTCPA